MVGKGSEKIPKPTKKRKRGMSEVGSRSPELSFVGNCSARLSAQFESFFDQQLEENQRKIVVFSVLENHGSLIDDSGTHGLPELLEPMVIVDWTKFTKNRCL